MTYQHFFKNKKPTGISFLTLLFGGGLMDFGGFFFEGLYTGSDWVTNTYVRGKCYIYTYAYTYTLGFP